MLKRQAPQILEIASATPLASAGDRFPSEAPSGLNGQDWTELLMAAAAFMLLMPVLKAIEVVSSFKGATRRSIRR